MALTGIAPVGVKPQGKSALDNAYKAFDLATTLAGLFGQSSKIYGTNAPNYNYLAPNQNSYLGFNSSGNSLMSAYKNINSNPSWLKGWE